MRDVWVHLRPRPLGSRLSWSGRGPDRLPRWRGNIAATHASPATSKERDDLEPPPGPGVRSLPREGPAL